MGRAAGGFAPAAAPAWASGAEPWRPRRYATVAEAVEDLDLDRTARYVTWQPSWDRLMLEEVFATRLGRHDVLVLPERADPYLVDSSNGFRASGVTGIQGRHGMLPVSHRYLNRDARTWFAMARAGRGILGLGPGSVIAPSPSGFRQERQIRPRGTTEDGWTSPGRSYRQVNGSTGPQLVGCMEALIELAHPWSIVANLTFRGADFGGVAWHTLSTRNRARVTGRRLQFLGAHQGFAGVPNGESAAMQVSSYDLVGVRVDCTDPTGRRVGSSPLMVNDAAHGHLSGALFERSTAGMPTIWNSRGLHRWHDVHSLWSASHGVNLETLGDGFHLHWSGGRIWSGRHNDTDRPSPDGRASTGMHLAVSPRVAGTRVTLEDVSIDRLGLNPGTLCVQRYSSSHDTAIDYTVGGARVPVRVY